jgi:hypothetical protein
MDQPELDRHDDNDTEPDRTRVSSKTESRCCEVDRMAENNNSCVEGYEIASPNLYELSERVAEQIKVPCEFRANKAKLTRRIVPPVGVFSPRHWVYFEILVGAQGLEPWTR